MQDSLTAVTKTNRVAYALERLTPKQQKLLQDSITQLADTLR